MKKVLFTLTLLLILSVASASAAVGPLTEETIQDVLTIISNYDFDNQTFMIQARNQIVHAVKNMFQEAVANNSASTFREQVREIAQNVDDYDFNNFCAPAVVMAPRDTAVGWIVSTAKNQTWLRQLYREN